MPHNDTNCPTLLDDYSFFLKLHCKSEKCMVDYYSMTLIIYVSLGSMGTKLRLLCRQTKTQTYTNRDLSQRAFLNQNLQKRIITVISESKRKRKIPCVKENYSPSKYKCCQLSQTDRQTNRYTHTCTGTNSPSAMVYYNKYNFHESSFNLSQKGCLNKNAIWIASVIKSQCDIELSLIRQCWYTKSLP